ncbi:hypothetical protein FB451DRAFT_1276008 [Mycena latifolia]|nr:hypothetical protein FB451DRAFT_1276008 [Mycena latifolia]
MVLRRFGPLSFCALSLLNTALFSAQAAPLGRPGGIYGRGQYSRQSEIDSLVKNITGQTVSDNAGLAQSLGSLFGGSSNSSTPDTPSATISDSLSQSTINTSLPSVTLPDNTPSATIPLSFTGNTSIPSATVPDSGPIVSQFTSTATVPVPTGSGAGSEAGEAFSILSQVVGAIPTVIPSVPVPTSVSIPSSGFDEPASDPDSDFPDTSHSQHSGTVSQIPDCAETYTVVSGDTCAAICSVFDLSAADFLRMNPSVGAACMNLQIGQEYCVQQSPEDEDDEEEDEYDEDDAEEDDGDGWEQKTVVNVHNHPEGAPCTCQGSEMQAGTTPHGGYSPSDIPVPLPAVTSTPSSPLPSEVPVPALPTSDPSSNTTGFNSTVPTPTISTPSLPTSESSSNSTGFNSTSQPDPDSTGDVALGNDTSANPLASQPAPSDASLGPAVSFSTPISADSSAVSGAAGVGSRATPLASAVPKAVKVTYEEDF